MGCAGRCLRRRLFLQTGRLKPENDHETRKEMQCAHPESRIGSMPVRSTGVGGSPDPGSSHASGIFCRPDVATTARRPKPSRAEQQHAPGSAAETSGAAGTGSRRNRGRPGWADRRWGWVQACGHGHCSRQAAPGALVPDQTRRYRRRRLSYRHSVCLVAQQPEPSAGSEIITQPHGNRRLTSRAAPDQLLRH